MKIKYNKPINLIEFVNESNYIAVNKKKLFETKKYPVYNTFKKNLGTCICYTLLLIIEILFYIKTRAIFAKIFCYILGVIVFIILISLISFIKIYLDSKKKNLNGILSINKEGIIDEDSETKVKYDWNDVSYIIIGKYSFNIFFDNKNIYLRLPINIKEDLVKAVEKYSDVEIIDLTIND